MIWPLRPNHASSHKVPLQRLTLMVCIFDLPANATKLQLSCIQAQPVLASGHAHHLDPQPGLPALRRSVQPQPGRCHAQVPRPPQAFDPAPGIDAGGREPAQLACALPWSRGAQRGNPGSKRPPPGCTARQRSPSSPSLRWIVRADASTLSFFSVVMPAVSLY